MPNNYNADQWSKLYHNIFLGGNLPAYGAEIPLTVGADGVVYPDALGGTMIHLGYTSQPKVKHSRDKNERYSDNQSSLVSRSFFNHAIELSFQMHQITARHVQIWMDGTYHLQASGRAGVSFGENSKPVPQRLVVTFKDEVGDPMYYAIWASTMMEGGEFAPTREEDAILEVTFGSQLVEGRADIFYFSFPPARANWS